MIDPMASLVSGMATLKGANAAADTAGCDPAFAQILAALSGLEASVNGIPATDLESALCASVEAAMPGSAVLGELLAETPGQEAPEDLPALMPDKHKNDGTTSPGAGIVLALLSALASQLQPWRIDEDSGEAPEATSAEIAVLPGEMVAPPDHETASVLPSALVSSPALSAGQPGTLAGKAEPAPVLVASQAVVHGLQTATGGPAFENADGSGEKSADNLRAVTEGALPTGMEEDSEEATSEGMPAVLPGPASDGRASRSGDSEVSTAPTISLNTPAQSTQAAAQLRAGQPVLQSKYAAPDTGTPLETRTAARPVQAGSSGPARQDTIVLTGHTSEQQVHDESSSTQIPVKRPEIAVMASLGAPSGGAQPVQGERAENENGADSSALPEVSFGQASHTSRVMPEAKPEEHLRAAENRSVVDQIARNAHLFLARGRTGLSIELEPRELGKVGIHVSVGSEGLHIRLAAETNDVRGIIQASLPQLRAALESQGLSIDRFDLALGTSFSGFGSPGDPARQESDLGNARTPWNYLWEEQAGNEGGRSQELSTASSLVDLRV